LRLSAIAAYIKSHGERPAAPCVADGEMLNSSFTLYGGGAAFVVGTDHIWHLTGNGADGDDWSRNNVSGGSIGYRIPIDSAIADELRHLDSHRSDVVQLDVPQFLDEGLDDWPHL
jgi:hypothetical protein